MNFKSVLVAVALVVIVGAAWKSYGIQGLLFAVGLITMWMMININRTMTVMRKAANRPIGYVSNAVMLNARLKPNVTLMHVTAMTESLGKQLSQPDVEPAVYQWTDGGSSSVVATFKNGKLSGWELHRPVTAEDQAAEAPGLVKQQPPA